MQEIFYKLQLHVKAGLPYAIYRKPGAGRVTGIFQNDNNAYYTENFTESGFVISPFSDGKHILIPWDKSDIIKGDVSKYNYENKFPAQWPVLEKDKAAYKHLVNDALKAIHNSEFEKVVLSRREIIKSQVNIVKAFKKLLQLYPNAFVYCFYHQDTGIWMGATPEQLLKANNNVIYTVALAGTQLYKGDIEVEWQDKEKHEQQIVTNYIVETLKLLTNNITVSRPHTYRAGNLVHIKTDISAEIIKKYTLKDVLKMLHPTPAVCGMPKQAAINFIKDNEQYDREYYSGFLGEINSNADMTNIIKTDLYVNLRCMKVENDSVNLYMGCGITADSIPEKELLETINKSNTLKKIL